MLTRYPRERLRVFVVWEPVLPTDWAAPSSFTLARIGDARVQQYWDKGRLLSKAMGEKDKSSIVWDWVGVYPKDSQWRDRPPKPSFGDGPIVEVLPALDVAVRGATQIN